MGRAAAGGRLRRRHRHGTTCHRRKLWEQLFLERIRSLVRADAEAAASETMADAPMDVGDAELERRVEAEVARRAEADAVNLHDGWKPRGRTCEPNWRASGGAAWRTRTAGWRAPRKQRHHRRATLPTTSPGHHATTAARSRSMTGSLPSSCSCARPAWSRSRRRRLSPPRPTWTRTPSAGGVTSRIGWTLGTSRASTPGVPSAPPSLRAFKSSTRTAMPGSRSRNCDRPTTVRAYSRSSMRLAMLAPGSNGARPGCAFHAGATAGRQRMEVDRGHPDHHPRRNDFGGRGGEPSARIRVQTGQVNLLGINPAGTYTLAQQAWSLERCLQLLADQGQGEECRPPARGGQRPAMQRGNAAGGYMLEARTSSATTVWQVGAHRPQLTRLFKATAAGKWTCPSLMVLTSGHKRRRRPRRRSRRRRLQTSRRRANETTRRPDVESTWRRRKQISEDAAFAAKGTLSPQW